MKFEKNDLLPKSEYKVHVNILTEKQVISEYERGSSVPGFQAAAWCQSTGTLMLS